MIELTLLTVLHIAATALPCVAAAILARNRGVTDAVLLAIIAIAAGGVFAYLTFWAFFASRELGIALSIAVPIASLTYLVAATPNLKEPDEPLRQLGQPLLLWMFGSIFILALGFLHGGTDASTGMAATRFSGQLPTDNHIPYYFAFQFFQGDSVNPPAPFPGEWLSSDRPPLQIGYVLTQMGMGETHGELSYQVHSVILQQTWIVGFWALLTVVGLSARTRAVALLAALVTDITILNGFFVWPKLLPATFLLLALALVFSPRWKEYRRDARIGTLMALLIGSSLLSHGGGIFGVLPIVILAFLRGVPDLRWIGVALLTGLVLMGSWTAYQRFVDPPGDRLVKWHLGGVVDVTEESTPEAIFGGYADAGVKGTIDNKVGNLDEVVGYSRIRELSPIITDAIGSGNARSAIEGVRIIRFFSTLPALGFLLLAPIIMLFGIGRRRSQGEENEWRFGVCTLGLGVVGTVAWMLVAFGGPAAGTVIHVGSLSLPLMMIAGCVVGMMSVAPRLSMGIVLFNVITVLILYMPSFTPWEGTSYSPAAALVVVVSLAGFVASAFLLGSQSPVRAATSSVNP